MKRLCTLILALLFTISLSAQQMAKGIVYDDSGIPVGGVLASVDGDNSTTRTHALNLQGGSDKIQAAASIVNT